MTPVAPSFSNSLAAAWARPALAKTAGASTGSVAESGVAAPGSRFGDVLADNLQSHLLRTQTLRGAMGSWDQVHEILPLIAERNRDIRALII